jgi:hypothetical protein
LTDRHPRWRNGGDGRQPYGVDYHYRLIASIALAESARQIGRTSADRPGTRVRPLTYSLVAPFVDEAEGIVVDLDELSDY